MELDNATLTQLRNMQSRIIGVDEFNFDNMVAPPISTFLDITDIADLESIATSIRYSGQLSKKKKMIQQILVKRGFDKAYWSGTNRVTYKHYDYPNIVMKIAVDDKGRNDNPREFFNQNLLKPFVTKVFEVAGDGTVALVERVVPIRTREEYMSVADDVFKILWLITKRYIMADVGSNYFLNVGIRAGFGVVYLDYPYLYEPDGSKLVCHVKNPQGIECGGLIDYDSGFNNLICTKCGAKYNASEIAKILKGREPIIRERGNEQMKVGIVRGDRKVITLDTIAKVDESGIVRPVTSITPTNNENKTEQAPREGKKITINIRKSIEESNKKKAASNNIAGKVSVKRNAKQYKKSTRSNESRNNQYGKVKIDRTSKPTEHVRRSQVPITAVTLNDLTNTTMKVSSYDAENQLIFAKGKTQAGVDVSINIDANSLPWDELDAKVESVSSTDPEYPNLKEELEKAKADLLAIEAEKIELQKKFNSLLEDNQGLVDTAMSKDKRIVDLENQLKVSKDEHTNDSENDSMVIENLNKEIESLKEENDRLSERANLQDQTIDELTTDKEALEKQVEELSNSASSSEELIAKDNELIAANKKIEELADTVSYLQNELEATKIELSKPREIKQYDTVGIEESLKLSLMPAELRYTKDLVKDIKDPENEDLPESVLTFPMDFVDDDGKQMHDFLRDQDNNILAVYSINDVLIDNIKFEDANINKTNVEEK